MYKQLLWKIEDCIWQLKCRYNFFLHGPYGVSHCIEKMPFHHIVKYLRKYGANIGENCRFEKGLKLHRPDSRIPFKNLTIGENVYIGHDVILDLTECIEIEKHVCIGARSQIWTHTGFYSRTDTDDPMYKEKRNPVIVKEGTIIYSNVIISNGLTIGKFSRIGAGSVVVKDVNPLSFCAGVPSREVTQSTCLNSPNSNG